MRHHTASDLLLGGGMAAVDSDTEGWRYHAEWRQGLEQQHHDEGGVNWQAQTGVESVPVAYLYSRCESIDWR